MTAQRQRRGAHECHERPGRVDDRRDYHDGANRAVRPGAGARDGAEIPVCALLICCCIPLGRFNVFTFVFTFEVTGELATTISLMCPGGGVEGLVK